MSRLGWFLVNHRRLLLATHRIAHRTGDKACWVCEAVWAYIESLPGTVDGLREGMADLAAGRTVRYRADELHTHFYPWAEVRASKQGGPAPKCRTCGSRPDDL